MLNYSTKIVLLVLGLLLAGSGAAHAQDISADPDSYDFGKMLLSESQDQVITISNNAILPLTINSVSLVGQNSNQFLIVSGGGAGIIPGNGSNDITVRFIPSSTGVKVAALQINSNDPADPVLQVPLTGTVVSPEISISPNALGYNNVKVGTTVRREIVVTNLGSSPLTVSSATISGPNAELFDVVPGLVPFTIGIPPAARRDTIRVDFSPTVTGNKTAYLTIFSDDVSEPEIVVELTGNGVRPDIATDVPAIEFGDVAVGDNSTLGVQIINEGDGSLVVESTVIMGTDPAPFQVVGGGGASVIGPGNSRTVNVRFAPSDLGSREAFLRIVSDDPDENPVDIPLSGTGIGLPEISLNRSNINFGNVRVDGVSVQEVVVSNLGLSELTVNAAPFTGPNPDQFLVQTVNLPFNLAPATRDTIRVEFRPTSTGNKSAYLNVTSNDPNEQLTQVLVFGDGVRSDITVDKTLLDFGDVAIGSSGTDLVTITNRGTGTLSIFSTELIGTDADQFRVSSNSGSSTIAPNSARAIGVQFIPTAFGGKTATLRIENDDPAANPLDITLSGTGFGQPDIAVNRSAVAFNNVRVGTSSVQEVIVTNVGLADLRVTDASYVGTDANLFSTLPGLLPMDIAPSGRDTLRIAFTPASGGNKSASVILSSNDPDENPLEIPLTGQGVRPEFQLSDSSHDFGQVAAGTATPFDFTIFNAGNGNLNIISTTLEGADPTQFRIAAGGGATTIAPSGARVITVEFIPNSAGPKSASLRLETDDLVSPVVNLSLSGTGQTIQIDAPTMAAPDQDVSLGLTFPPGFPATGGTLYYRLAGETIYRTAERSAAGSESVAIIPASAATIGGIEYYAVATNDIATITLPATTPQTTPFFLPVRVSQLEPPTTVEFSPLSYRMISVPARLDNPTVAAVLGDDYDEYNSRRWRLFRWEKGDYAEYPNIQAQFTPGAGFWLITSDGQSFDVEGAESVNPADPLEIELVPGWNQVGNPYAFLLSWPGDFIDPGIEDPVAFDGVEFQFGTNVLNPWEGYFVFNSGTSTVSISLSPRDALAKTGSSTGNGAHSTSIALEPGEYTVQLSASVRGTNTRDTQNFVGVRLGADDGRDHIDFAEPPPIGSTLRLSSIVGDERLAGNFKPASNDGAFWDFELQGNGSDHPVDVQFSTIGALPEGSDLYALDLSRRLAIPIEDGAISVENPDSDETLSFRLIIGPSAYAQTVAEDISLVPTSFELEQNYPNPFNPETAIRYRVGTNSHVRLAVYDLLGRRVRMLVDEQMEAGAHTARWDGRNADGLPVASGVYMYRLESSEFRATRTMVVLR